MAKDKDKRSSKDSSQEQKAPAQAQHSAKERPRLRTRFDKEVAPALLKELELKNAMAVPRLNKIVVNMGMGEATQNSKILDPAVNELGQITGQKPIVTKAKKSIAAFKVREGQAIGTMVTLRGDRMYEFFDRLVNIVLPRVRDFKGVSTKSFDGRGNYTHRTARPVDLPGDFLREGRQDERHERHHRDHGGERQPGAHAAEASGHAVPSVARLKSFKVRVERFRFRQQRFSKDGMTTAKRVKDAKIEKKFEDGARQEEKTPKFSTRRHNRCKSCGRPRAYLRKFGLCRLCFRELALRGEIPGVSKSSW